MRHARLFTQEKQDKFMREPSQSTGLLATASRQETWTKRMRSTASVARVATADGKARSCGDLGGREAHDTELVDHSIHLMR